MRTITLPETHIFTPEKGTKTISQPVDRETPSQSDSCIVKEYRDVEYCLDKCIAPQILKPDSVPFTTTTTNHAPIGETFQRKLEPTKSSFPIFGTSPTEKLTIMNNSQTQQQQIGKNDDDFSDFQTAALPPPIPPPIEPLKPKVNPVTLSPEHLLINGNAWTNSTVDDDEMLRIEAFARSKNSNTSSSNSITQNAIRPRKEDDEWCDFVSSAPPIKTQDSIMNKNNSSASSNNKQEDDWSDFVFTTPASSQPIIPQKQWNSPLPATYTAGNYIPWSTGQSAPPPPPITNVSNTFRATTAAGGGSAKATVPELSFVAPKQPFMRK